MKCILMRVKSTYKKVKVSFDFLFHLRVGDIHFHVYIRVSGAHLLQDAALMWM